MTLQTFIGKFERHFAALLESGDYRQAYEFYLECDEREILQQLWHEAYRKLLDCKKYGPALDLAEKFKADRQWLERPATGLVRKALQRHKYHKVVQLLRRFPVDYFEVAQWIAALPHSNSGDIGKLKETVRYRVHHDFGHALDTLVEAQQAMLECPYRRGYLLQLPEDCEVLISGDLHGNRINLERLLAEARLDKYPERHLIFQEIIHSRSLLVDQRDLSFLEVLDILKCLVKFPKQVHILLGNHDLNLFLGRETLRRKKKLNALFLHGLELIFGGRGADICDKYRALVPYMAAGVAWRNLFISHSNPSRENAMHFKRAVLQEDIPLSKNPLIADLVNGRDHSEDTVAAMLEGVQAEFSVIGHEICYLGYETPNSRQLIVDSCHNQGFYLKCPPQNFANLKNLKKCLRPLRPEIME